MNLIATILLNPNKFSFLKMEYQAIFRIDCGVSPGFGVKYPDNLERTEKIVADNPEIAYQKAMNLARKFADNYLSNPETDLTTVQLLSLNGSEGAVLFDAEKAIVRRNSLQHLLSLASESF